MSFDTFKCYGKRVKFRFALLKWVNFWCTYI